MRTSSIGTDRAISPAWFFQIISFDETVWRLLLKGLAAEPPVFGICPGGRFHHSWQAAAYASFSAEVAIVAIQRYFGDGVERMLIPMRLMETQVADARGIPLASIAWQALPSTGEHSPTWLFWMRHGIWGQI